MPKKAQWPPRIFSHSSGQDRIRVQGVDIYLGKSGSEAARREYLRVVAELEAGKSPAHVAGHSQSSADASVTVEYAALHWLDHARQKYSKRGKEYEAHRRALAPVVRLFGHLPTARFDCDCLEAVQLAMARGSWQTEAERQAAAKRGKPCDWSRKVVNRAIVRVRTAWRWLERKRLVPEGSWARLSTLPGLSGSDARVRHLPKRGSASWEDVRACARYCPEPARTMLLLAWWSGARPAETRKLRLSELDRSDPDVWLYRPGEHKNEHRGHERVICFGPRCRALLGRFLSGCGPDDYLFRPRGQRAKNAIYSDDTYSRAVRRAADKAGVRVQPYQCRHSVKDRATEAAGLDDARSVLGQASLGTTNEYGKKLDLEKAKKFARKHA